jgi:hypothetical protein
MSQNAAVKFVLESILYGWHQGDEVRIEISVKPRFLKVGLKYLAVRARESKHIFRICNLTDDVIPKV